MIRICDVLQSKVTDLDACLAWATEKGYYVKKLYLEDECRYMAEKIQTKWEKHRVNKEKWNNVSFPSLEDDTITVQKLHEYLTEIMTLHPDIASCPVYHEECCGATETYRVKFRYGKGCIVLS